MSNYPSSICGSYCNQYGTYVTQQYCTGSTSTNANITQQSGGMYCCGTQDNRFCCNNFTQALPTSSNNPVSGCPDELWWIWPWLVVILSVLAFLCFPALCQKSSCKQLCSCCEGCFKSTNSSPSHHTTRHSRSAVEPEISDPSSQGSGASTLGTPSRGLISPPPYDVPSKDPPSYEEMTMQTVTRDHHEELPMQVIDRGFQESLTNMASFVIDMPPAYNRQVVNQREAFSTQECDREVDLESRETRDMESRVGDGFAGLPPDYTEIDISS